MKTRIFIEKWFIFLLLTNCLSISKTVSSQHSIEVYIYGFPGSLTLEVMRSYFSKIAGSKIIVYYLNNSYYVNEFLVIINALSRGGFKFCLRIFVPLANWLEG
jgi:hypothetical protein